MALEMRAECERCHAATPANARAFVCSFECTFCESCATSMFDRVSVDMLIDYTLPD